MIGEEIYNFTCKLFPINRFLMGEGVRETLNAIKEVMPEIKIYEVPSGTKVFDWVIPDEWNVSEAYIENEKRNKIVDYKENNLHVMVYSSPIDRWLSLEELKKYIYVNEELPDAIPYVTSYYKERIGMCMSKNQLNGLQEGEYHICIKSTKEKGSMTYGEIILKGTEDDEVIIHSVLCHPSLANDELSGVALSVFLAKEIKAFKNHRYTYRFVFVPETIGAITYLSRNLEYLKKHVKAGFILSCEGDERSYSYLPTVEGNTLTDRVVIKAFEELQILYNKYSFLQRGSDERQYNSPGVDIPVCLVCRSKAEEFPEYHTSMDNLEFVSPNGFQGSFELFMHIIKILEMNKIYKTKVLCEPQLGKRGLYSDINCYGSKLPFRIFVDFLAYSNGKNDLITMSDILGEPCEKLNEVAKILLENDLIERV